MSEKYLDFEQMEISEYKNIKTDKQLLFHKVLKFIKKNCIILISFIIILIMLCKFLFGISENSYLKNQIIEYKSQYAELEKQNNNYQNNHDQLIKEISSLKNLMLDLNKTYYLMTLENNGKINKFNVMQQRIKEIKDNITFYNNKIKECNDNITKLQNKAEELEKSKSKLTPNLESILEKYKKEGGVIEEDKPESKKEGSSTDINSTILTNPEYIKIINDFFNSKFKRLNLLYRASIDGFSVESFTSKTEKHFNIIIFIKTNKDFILGGFSKFPCTDHSTYAGSMTTFLFNINTKNTKDVKHYFTKDLNNMFICNDANLFNFGNGDLVIKNNDFIIKSNFPVSYKEKEPKKLELTNGFSEVTALEIEAFTFA